MKTTKENYLYALGFKWLAPLYDLAVKIIINEEEFRAHIVRAANIKPHHKVVDLGCGTASLAIKIKQEHPQAEVTGLDGDNKILGIARGKIDGLKLDIALQEGMIFRLPYPDNSFDRVFSTLTLHHLKTEDKVKALQEIWRILAPLGEIHVADFDKAAGKDNVLVGFLKNLHPHKIADTRRSLEQMLADTGFTSVRNQGIFKTMVGKIYCLGAIKG
ncbi:MAG: methyltransferase domain-containing protein [Candidatus Brocadiia bacterium]